MTLNHLNYFIFKEFLTLKNFNFKILFEEVLTVLSKLKFLQCFGANYQHLKTQY